MLQVIQQKQRLVALAMTLSFLFLAHQEDVSLDEMRRRMAAMATNGEGAPGRRAQQQQQ